MSSGKYSHSSCSYSKIFRREYSPARYLYMPAAVLKLFFFTTGKVSDSWLLVLASTYTQRCSYKYIHIAYIYIYLYRFLSVCVCVWKRFFFCCLWMGTGMRNWDKEREPSLRLCSGIYREGCDAVISRRYLTDIICINTKYCCILGCTLVFLKIVLCLELHHFYMDIRTYRSIFIAKLVFMGVDMRAPPV